MRPNASSFTCVFGGNINQFVESISDIPAWTMRYFQDTIIYKIFSSRQSSGSEGPPNQIKIFALIKSCVELKWCMF